MVLHGRHATFCIRAVWAWLLENVSVGTPDQKKPKPPSQRKSKHTILYNFYLQLDSNLLSSLACLKHPHTRTTAVLLRSCTAAALVVDLIWLRCRVLGYRLLYNTYSYDRKDAVILWQSPTILNLLLLYGSTRTAIYTASTSIYCCTILSWRTSSRSNRIAMNSVV